MESGGFHWLKKNKNGQPLYPGGTAFIHSSKLGGRRQNSISEVWPCSLTGAKEYSMGATGNHWQSCEGRVTVIQWLKVDTVSLSRDISPVINGGDTPAGTGNRHQPLPGTADHPCRQLRVYYWAGNKCGRHGTILYANDRITLTQRIIRANITESRDFREFHPFLRLVRSSTRIPEKERLNSGSKGISRSFRSSGGFEPRTLRAAVIEGDSLTHSSAKTSLRVNRPSPLLFDRLGADLFVEEDRGNWASIAESSRVSEQRSTRLVLRRFLN
ncbi:hypothetical protein B0H11DRAFT_1918927 [Mycena galericulata]|nr:hypothetical protein B0H11DRAFT_1918927 [Mycena galericulata]